MPTNDRMCENVLGVMEDESQDFILTLLLAMENHGRRGIGIGEVDGRMMEIVPQVRRRRGKAAAEFKSRRKGQYPLPEETVLLMTETVEGWTRDGSV
ncbi:hypothetical protein CRG98_040696 [Punica granatum]|uniref:Uncharacterized protein n=1 Tax=Punica granatum TaxID=22663 RepID=A0A2I0I4L2_PUNGR|nr:hypothetical protein CRG98_040696 [Punica granatum]